jgi:hypothetical protein
LALLVLFLAARLHSIGVERGYWQQMLERKPQKSVSNLPVPRISEEELGRLDALMPIVRQINGVTSHVFNILSDIAGENVAFLEVELGGSGKGTPGSASDGAGMPVMKLVVEARSPEALYAFWDRLNRHPSFSNIRMSEHSHQDHPGYKVEVARFNLYLTGILPKL